MIEGAGGIPRPTICKKKAKRLAASQAASAKNARRGAQGPNAAAFEQQSTSITQDSLKRLAAAASVRVANVPSERLLDLDDREVLGGISRGVASHDGTSQVPVCLLVLVSRPFWKAPIDEIQHNPKAISIVNRAIPNLDGTVDHASERQGFNLHPWTQVIDVTMFVFSRTIAERVECRVCQHVLVARFRGKGCL